jgi:hypothetical protein
MRALFTALACAMSSGLAAQRPTIIKLPPADARLETAFTAITSIRELSDGRIIVSDPRDLQLIIADFRSRRVQPISRKGAGPGEYGMAGPARPLSGDSSLLVDFMQRRWLLLDGERVVATIPPDNPIIRRTTMGMVSGADRLGHVVFGASADPPDGPSVTSRKESTSVVRVHRGTGRVVPSRKSCSAPRNALSRGTLVARSRPAVPGRSASASASSFCCTLTVGWRSSESNRSASTGAHRTVDGRSVLHFPCR